MKKIIVLMICCLTLNAGFVRAEEAKKDPDQREQPDRREYVQQQMVLMGLYLYGIQKEIGQKKINYDNLEFLADSLSGITEQMKNAKGEAVFHANLSDLLEKVKALKAASANDHDQVKSKARAVVQTCGRCHRSGVNP